MHQFASALGDAPMRAWIWAVVGGLVLGGLLLAHAGLAIGRAFPDDVRANAVGAIKKRPRLAFTSAGVATWTLLYALYSLAYPSGAALLASDTRTPSTPQRLAAGPPFAPAPGVDFSDLLSPSLGAISLGGGTTTTPSGDNSTTAPPPGDSPGNKPPECSTAAQAEMLREAQKTVEELTGRPLGADAGVFIEAAAGCKDPTSAALSLLGPINQLLNDAGVPVLDLPVDIPGVDFPTIPEAIAAPLRPQVFNVCGRILAQGYSVASAAPVLRISFEDAVAVLNIVSSACTAFAPARSSS
jgi:hypothetical protein